MSLYAHLILVKSVVIEYKSYKTGAETSDVCRDSQQFWEQEDFPIMQISLQDRALGWQKVGVTLHYEAIQSKESKARRQKLKIFDSIYCR